MALVGMEMVNPGFGTTMTASITVTAGEQIVICTANGSGVAFSSASDTDGNTYTKHATGGTAGQSVFSASAAYSGTITVTLTLSSSRTGKAAFIWTVPPSTYANFAYETSTTSSTDQTCGSITTTAGQIVIAINVNSNATHYVGTGYTASINDSLYAYFSQAKITAGGTDTGAHTASTARSSQYNYIVSFTQKTPVNTSAPVLSGTPTEGSVLSCTTGTWDTQGNGALTYTYQWTRSNDGTGTGEVDISGATISTYTLVAGDVGKYIRCRVRASNDGGYDAAADRSSNFSAVITSGGDATATLTATLDGVTAASAVASLITAGLTATLDGVSVIAAAGAGSSASLTATLAGVTASSSVTSPINAAATATLDGATATSAATSPISAGVTSTLDGVTVASSASVDAGASATLTAQLDGVTASSSVISPLSAGLTATLAGVTASGAAVSTIAAGVTATLGGVTVTSTLTAGDASEVSLSSTLDGVTVTASAIVGEPAVIVYGDPVIGCITDDPLAIGDMIADALSVGAVASEVMAVGQVQDTLLLAVGQVVENKTHC